MIKGQIYVLSGPSGVGKGTIVKEVLKKGKDVVLSVSATTRPIREGEAEGINYYYKSHNEFERMIETNEFMEWASFCDNYYGTPKAAVFDKINRGIDVILEIETKGAMKIKEEYPESVFIFIAPPSLEVLEERLRGRGTESEEVILKRLGEAKRELTLASKYDYMVVNDTVDVACDDILTIMKADRFKTSRREEYII